MKESGLRIRVDEQLRASFIASCKQDDLTASQVIRAFMRSYVENKHVGQLQQDLFEEVVSYVSSIQGKDNE